MNMLDSKKVNRNAMIFIAHTKTDLMTAEIDNKKVNTCNCLICEDWDADFEVMFSTGASIGYVEELYSTISIADSKIIFELRKQTRAQNYKIVIREMEMADTSPMIGRVA